MSVLVVGMYIFRLRCHSRVRSVIPADFSGNPQVGSLQTEDHAKMPDSR